jgi:hypothetical protein
MPPDIYPQDYAGPRTTGTSQTQQVGPRTSYRQEADGTMTEIGYDGQPVSGYTQQQWAMHNATTGVTPSELMTKESLLTGSRKTFTGAVFVVLF